MNVIIRNKTDLKRFVANHNDASTDDMVEAINIKLNLMICAGNEEQHHRLEAGRMLVELRNRVEGEGENWWQWQKGKFDRSRRDMEKLMRLARAEDPQAAAEAAAKSNCQHQAKHRQKERDAAYVSRNPIDRIIELIRGLTEDQRMELLAKLKEELSW